MNEFFKWLLAVGPIGINIVVSALVAFIIVQFLQRYEVQVISIVPLNIKLNRALTKKTVRIGDVNFPDTKDNPKAAEFYNGTWTGDREVKVPVPFIPPFRDHVDYVTVSLKKIDIGNPHIVDGNPHIVEGINRLEVHTGEITTTGFNLYFKTWLDTRVWNAQASWIAIGE